MARTRRIEAASVDFTDHSQARGWFDRQPRDVAVTLAVRAALRVLPLVFEAHALEGFATRIVMPVFRVSAVGWTVAKHKALAARLYDPIGAVAAAAYAAANTADNIAAAFNYAAVAYAAANAVDACNAAAYAATAADATAAAYATYAAAATTTAIKADAVAIEAGGNGSEVAGRPLWPANDMPPAIAQAWIDLQSLLTASGDGWGVWISWYGDRLMGRPSLGQAFDLAVAELPDELWQDPPALNARIAELIAEHTPSEPIPAQGAGPHFAFNRDLKIGLAPPSEIDTNGNNIGRIASLLPIVRQAADDLAGNVNPNAEPELSRSLADYRAAIAGELETIAWGTVFGLGVRLENAAAAARREIADRLREPFEDAAQEALDSVLLLHGPLILATAEGRELTDAADSFRLTQGQRQALRDDAQAIVEDLRNSPDIIDAAAAQTTQAAAETAAKAGPHPERGEFYWLATIRNAATVFLPVALVAAPVIVGVVKTGPIASTIGAPVVWGAYEVFKATPHFKAATLALGADLGRVIEAGTQGSAQLARRLTPFRVFVTRHIEPLRRIAEIGQYRWMLRYLDFIDRTNRTP